MKANELRIGNYLESSYYDISKRDFDVFQISEGWEIDDIDLDLDGPIRLTEDWLLKFGFEKTNNTAEYPNYTKGVYKCLWRNGKTNICNRHGFIKDLKYVHELQNLYFALTNKELTLKT